MEVVKGIVIIVGFAYLFGLMGYVFISAVKKAVKKKGEPEE